MTLREARIRDGLREVLRMIEAEGLANTVVTVGKRISSRAYVSFEQGATTASSLVRLRYKGKVTAYDSPIYIADAALYLKATKPELGIKDPYALDEKQLAAAVDLLKAQAKNVGEYWSDYLKQQQAFENGDSVIGTSWQFIVNLIDADKKPIKAILPDEGSTGWSDTWMIAAKSKHPNCAYAWMDYIAGRGFDSVVSPSQQQPFLDSECVSCGACVQACPTDALTVEGELGEVVRGEPVEPGARAGDQEPVGVGQPHRQVAAARLHQTPLDEGGYFDQTAQLWNEAAELLVTTHQVVYYKE